jgi:RNA polymerase sigma-70 factor (ECF subfamily)
MTKARNGRKPVVIVFEVSETELILKARDGDRNAFNELVRIHAQGVMNVIYRMCGDAQVAEDAAQETFIRAWSHLGSFRVDSSLRNWLYRIALQRRHRHASQGKTHPAE